MESANPSPKIGDQVLIMDQDTKRSEWLTNFVTDVLPKGDGVIKKAVVITTTSH